MEIRKVLGDESGALQVPTVKANEVAPLAPGTRVKITQLESNIITPSATSSTQLQGDTTVNGDVAVSRDKTLYVDKLEKTGVLTDALTIKSKTKIEGHVEMPRLTCSYIEPSLNASARVEGDTITQGDTTVLAGKKLYVSEIRTASRNLNPIDNNITLVGK